MEEGKYYLATDTNVAFQASKSDVNGANLANANNLYIELTEDDYCSLQRNAKIETPFPDCLDEITPLESLTEREPTSEVKKKRTMRMPSINGKQLVEMMAKNRRCILLPHITGYKVSCYRLVDKKKNPLANIKKSVVNNLKLKDQVLISGEGFVLNEEKLPLKLKLLLEEEKPLTFWSKILSPLKYIYRQIEKSR